MSPAGLEAKLSELLAMPAETEWVEFKENNVNPQEIGEYLSALSNAAALHGQAFGYIVWGVEDGTRSLKGTSFRPHRTKGCGNEDLEPWLARLLAPRMDFTISEFTTDNVPVVLIQVQAAVSSPVAFSGREWIRVGSHKKPLRDYPEKERKLWQRLSSPAEDWSACVCENATLEDLDPAAITLAREEYKSKNPNLSAEVDRWDHRTFLNKAKVCIDGKLTRAAIILLGKPESTYHLSPTIPQMSWILKDEHGMARDYKHFGPPFLITVNQVSSQIRNLTCRVMASGTLFPVEIPQYDNWVLREVLHNAIAHQDYSRSGRINIVEFDDRLIVANPGQFLPGDVEEVIRRDAPFSDYRNPFLAQAMVGLQMIDTIGSGIKRVFQAQKTRSFPMPDYDLKHGEEVQVSIIGKILDEKYTRMLMARKDLDLWEVIALDKVQKGRPLTDDEFKLCKRKKLVEGRRPNLYVSAEIAAATETKAEYIRNRAFDKDHYQKLVLSYLGRFREAKRSDLQKLLLDKLSDTLDEQQKTRFIGNLIQEMRQVGLIERFGEKRWARWRLTQPEEKSAD